MGKNNYHHQKPVKKVPVAHKPQLIHKESANNKKQWLFATIAFLFAFLLYSNTFQHGWVLDDYGVFKDNKFVTQGVSGYSDILTHSYRHGSGNFTDNLYRPVSQLMFATEWELYPDNPGLSHFVNVLFYALNALLLCIILRKLFHQYNQWIPFAITLLYIAHPIHSEVVANIKSRDEILSFFFVLLTLLLFLQSISSQSITKKVILWGFSFILFTLGMFTKESGVTMLAAFPLIFYFFTTAKIKDYLGCLTVLGLSIGIYFVTKNSVLEAGIHKGGFTVAIVDNYFYDADLFTGWATAIMLLGKYVWLLVFPHPLACDYSYNQLPLVTFGNIWAIISLIFFVSITIFALLHVRKKSPISFGILFFIITMSITSNLIIRFGSSFGERFLFVPSLGFCIAIVFILTTLFKTQNSKQLHFQKNTKNFLITLFVFVLLLFSIKTVTRASDWKDQLTLFSTDVQSSPNSAHMRLYHALALRDKAKISDDLNKAETNFVSYQKNKENYITGNLKAIDELKKAVEIYPKYATAYEQLGLLYERTGKIQNNQKMIDTAESFYLLSLKYVPTTASVNSNVAKIYFERGEIQKAKQYYLKAIHFDPLFTDGYFNLGSSYGMLNQYDSSIYYFQKTVDLDPKRAPAYYYMGLTFTKINQLDKAYQMFDKAIQVDPKDVLAYILKAETYMKQKDYNEAYQLLNQAEKIQAFNAELYILRGQLEVIFKNFEKAQTDFSKAIQINPMIKQAYVEKINLFKIQNQPDSMQKYIQMINQIR